ncbi:DNA polymerase IV, partial [Methylobacterium radiotolerans]
RRAGWETSTVAIKIRFDDFRTVNRSQTLAEPTAVGQRIGEAAQGLFALIERRDPIRLVGVRAENLRPAGGSALALWDEDEDWRKVEGAVAAQDGRLPRSRSRSVSTISAPSTARRRWRSPPP